MKILINIHNGLNDLFNTLASVVVKFQELRINFDYTNIHLYSSVYTNLNDFFDFNMINYHTRLPDGTFDYIITNVCKCDKGLKLLRNKKLISLKTDIEEQLKLKNTYFVNKTAVHLRFRESERNFNLFEEELAFYKHLIRCQFLCNKFEDKNITIFSDVILNKDIFELNHSNIDFYPTINNINIKNKQFNRKEYILDTLNCLYALSLCKTVYKSKGSFVDLVQLISDTPPKILRLNLDNQKYGV